MNQASISLEICIFVLLYIYEGHIGRHLDFLKMLKDDRVSSIGKLMYRLSATKTHQNILYATKIKVKQKDAKILPDYMCVRHRIDFTLAR